MRRSTSFSSWRNKGLSGGGTAFFPVVRADLFLLADFFAAFVDFLADFLLVGIECPPFEG
jgi:hypothetical protein